jgi:hypothetical protein
VPPGATSVCTGTPTRPPRARSADVGADVSGARAIQIDTGGAARTPSVAQRRATGVRARNVGACRGYAKERRSTAPSVTAGGRPTSTNGATPVRSVRTPDAVQEGAEVPAAIDGAVASHGRYAVALSRCAVYLRPRPACQGTGQALPRGPLPVRGRGSPEFTGFGRAQTSNIDTSTNGADPPLQLTGFPRRWGRGGQKGHLCCLDLL